MSEPPRDITSVLLTEILLGILVYLPYRTLLACRTVCRSLKELIDGSESLQLVIELGAAGYTEYISRACTSAEALAHFRTIQRIYRTQSTRSLEDAVDLRPLPQPSRSAPHSPKDWIRLHGLLINTWFDEGDNGNMPATLVDIVQLAPASTEKRRMQLPTRHHSLRFDGFWETLLVDQEQDLLVQVHKPTAHPRPRAPDTLRLVSLRTGKPHARMVAITDGVLRVGDFWMIARVSLYDEWILVHSMPTVAQLGDAHLFHWPTGTRRRSWFNKKEKWHSMSGCIVGSLLILPQRAAPDASPHTAGPNNIINIYTLPSVEREEPFLLAIFELPAGVENVCISPFREQVMSRSNFGFGSELSLLELLLDDDLFTVPLSTFDADHWRSRGAKATGGRYPLRIPWNTWGPHSLHPSGSEWVGDPIAVVGLHVIYRAFTLDFNPLDAAKDVYSTRTSATHGDQPILETSVVRSGLVEEIASTHHQRGGTYPAPTGPVYRRTPSKFADLFSGVEDIDLHLVDGPDGTTIVRVVRDPEFDLPVELRFWSLE